MTRFQHRVRAHEDLAGERYQVQPMVRHVVLDLLPGALPVSLRDGAFTLFAQERRETFGKDDVRRPHNLTIDELGKELAVGLRHEQLHQDRGIEIQGASLEDQSRPSRSSRTITSAGRPLFFRAALQSRRLTRNGWASGPTATSLAFGRPSEVMMISSPDAARSKSSDRCAFA